MDISNYVRDPAKVLACLVELPDLRVVAKRMVKIYQPTRYSERGLSFIGAETMIVGIFAMVNEDQAYSVLMVDALIRIEPTSVTKVIIEEEEYYEFVFEPGSTVFATLNLVKTDTLVYRIYDEIVSKAKVPWYLGYLELARLFDTAMEHAGTRIGSNFEVTELIISLLARNPKDRHQYFRQSVQSLDELKTMKPEFIPLRNVTYAATNTTNRLAGSYFNVGVVSSLVTQSNREERIESLLRR